MTEGFPQPLSTRLQNTDTWKQTPGNRHLETGTWRQAAGLATRKLLFGLKGAWIASASYPGQAALGTNLSAEGSKALLANRARIW